MLKNPTVTARRLAVEPPPPPPEKIQLEMDVDVARSLMRVLGRVSGDPKKSRRFHIDLIYRALRSQNVAPAGGLEGGVSFTDDDPYDREEGTLAVRSIPDEVGR